jgi:hypothetical protein
MIRMKYLLDETKILLATAGPLFMPASASTIIPPPQLPLGGQQATHVVQLADLPFVFMYNFKVYYTEQTPSNGALHKAKVIVALSEDDASEKAEKSLNATLHGIPFTIDRIENHGINWPATMTATAQQQAGDS